MVRATPMKFSSFKAPLRNRPASGVANRELAIAGGLWCLRANTG
jgi:hypothetical protein